MTNEQRAAWAEIALAAYVQAKSFHSLESQFEERVDYARDLLVDLLHFIEDEGGMIDTDVGAILTATEINYQTEVEEEANG